MNYYIGLSLAANSGTDSGVAVLDEENNLILVDKLYKMDDVTHFFDNYPSLGQSHLCVSLAWDKTMLEGKWRIFGKQYQPVATNKNMPNRDNWTQRYANRGSDYFKGLCDKALSVNRFELFLTRQSMNLSSGFKERSPADCKFLQQTLRIEHGLDLPSNMMPMSQLEAMVGALLAREAAGCGNALPCSSCPCKPTPAAPASQCKTRIVGQFRDLDVIDVTNNPA